MRRLLLTLLVVLLAGFTVAQANFAVVEGFSGRYGATCASCHTPHPLFDDVEVRIDGLPDAWESEQEYPLSVHVTGGPPAIPNMPQGGFELETNLGRFETHDPVNLRVTIPERVTYTPEGTLLRSWSNITWVAPDALDQPPQMASFWVAGLAANGNHEAFLTNASALGELHDSGDARVYEIPASEGVESTWLETPLQPPVVEDLVPRPGGLAVMGVKGDPFTSEIRLRVDGGPFLSRQVEEGFEIHIEGSGAVLEIQGFGEGRSSHWVRYELQAGQTPEILPPLPETNTRGTPGFTVLPGLLVILCARRFLFS